MQIFHQGKFATKTFKVGAISAALLLGGCEVDGSSNEAPVFEEQAIDNSHIAMGLTYEGQILAKDADGDALLYTKVSGPEWLTINQNGSLSLALTKMSNEDVGSHFVVITVDDGHAKAETGVSLTVDNAPLFSSNNIADVIKADAGEPYTARIMATDLDDDSLTYTIVDAPAWLSLDGYTLTAEPTLNEFGIHNITVAVTDGKTTNEQSFALDVTAGQFFTADIISKPGGIDGELFAGSLANDAVGLGDLTFAQVYEKDEDDNDILTWLTVDENGEFSGVYDATAGGITVEVTDGGDNGTGFSSRAVLQITTAGFKTSTLERKSAAAIAGWSFNQQVMGDDGHDGAALTYTMVEDDLFEISSDGVVSNKRDIVDADISTHTLTVTTTDGIVSAESPVDIDVVAVNAIGTKDDFEADTNGWVNDSSEGTVVLLGGAKRNGSKGVVIKKSGSMLKYFSTLGKTDITLSYSRTAWFLNPEAGEYAQVQWSTDGVNWNTIEDNINNPDKAADWVDWTVDGSGLQALPVEASNQAVLAIRFKVITSGAVWAEQLRIDDVLVSGTDIVM